MTINNGMIPVIGFKGDISLIDCKIAINKK